MKLRPFRAAVALTTALTTAAAPLLAGAQTSYEFKSYKQGLVVSGSTSAPEAPAPGTPPPVTPQPALTLSTTAINFGEVATNTTETRQVLVSNPGTGSLTFTAAPAVTGAAEFAAGLTTCGTTLAAGADCLAEATFSPTLTGTFNGILTLTSVLASSPHEVSLVGTAFNPVSLASTTLPQGMVGKAYSYDFKQLLNVSNEASPDKSQATWEGSGTLPTGLSLDKSTGVLSGTPSVVTPGTTYTVTGTYKNNQGQQVYTIKVGDAVLEVVQIAAGQGDGDAPLVEQGNARERMLERLDILFEQLAQTYIQEGEVLEPAPSQPTYRSGVRYPAAGRHSSQKGQRIVSPVPRHGSARDYASETFGPSGIH